MHIQRAKAAGAKLIVIDPRKTHLARIADYWLAPKVGTDSVLALSMINVLFREDLVDRAFVDQWCIGTDELRQRASQYSPENAAAVTGVPVDVMTDVARIFATIKPGCLVLGHGIDAHQAAVETSIAFLSVLALTGNIDREGSNRAPKPLPGYKGGFAHFIQNPAFRIPKERQAQILGGGQFPHWAGPDSSTETCHNPTVLHAMLTEILIQSVLSMLAAPILFPLTPIKMRPSLH